MNFYENYVLLCNELGKTPSAVAIEIGLSKPSVNRWKNGGGVTDATAAKIAEYFDVPIGVLTGELDRKLFAENLVRLFKDHAPFEVDKTDIADNVGVSLETVIEWFEGKRFPRTGELEKLAQYFFVPVSYLTKEPSDVPTEMEYTFELDFETYDMVCMLINLNPKQKKAIKYTLEAMIHEHI